MKLSWGTGIAIFYSVFVIVLVFVVVKSTSIDNALVTDDYYKKDLEYQTQIDKQVNSQGLAAVRSSRRRCCLNVLASPVSRSARRPCVLCAPQTS